ncbi:MAG: imelysin family protein [Tabrizicola sp.]|uniref:imelysin family protein n=1 Tax=Tabrizicola sp. TaxID=2005166 RepID=UPI002734E46B|nr:imelysin family protein [Tabrizicola sp.]MDP3261537.1 imelysin family protein [Tabrizicola sp.]MDP3648394.1 imelysin family protein [Paracoccaceae bacterium]MDZ4065370.1 imelysin family protein [Tabrizicola sp.]
MKRTLLALGLAVVASAARADYPETVRDHILPGYAAFAETTASLAAKATETCDSALLEPFFQHAFDAWMGVQHLNFGPVEEDGHRLAIHYWPDPKASGAKAQMALLKGDPAKLAPGAFAQQSVAARGLMALERLLFPAEPLPADPCPLIRATATDLAATAAAVNEGWKAGYGDTMLTAGEPGNTTFLTSPEVRQVLFTQLASGLEFLSDNRIARPLGTFDAPHPERAEARASGRSLRNILLALQAMRRMVATLTPDAPLTIAAFDKAIALAAAMNDPTLAGVATPEGHLKFEILGQSVDNIRAVILSELAPEMDVGIGFNAADGD